MKTPLCELLGIEYPVIQGGMAWVSDAYLAAAVSNAGGLGIISAMSSNAEQVTAEIRKAKELTDKPFGVNIMLMSPHIEGVAQAVIDEKVPVITTGAGNPAKFMPAWLEAGIKVIPVVASTGVAKLVERSGACAVIAEGGEAGGHIGESTTMVLVPQVCDSVKIPVIAAGGIGDGRGLAASLMLGAVGVQMGTRFLVADECTIHQTYKDKVINARDLCTIATGRRLGHPVRALKSPFSREMANLEYDMTVSNEEFERKGAGTLRLAAREGDELRGSFMAGQIAAMVKKQQPAAEIIKEVVSEAEAILNNADKWLGIKSV
ncbi:MAG: enoyl-[acyl-carrier-protein] reductase FabK [Bacillales bacterium]|jgi:enoyl-[acyl-carrier protein] reductase II|nr:enoyl-[acyl-carrier-protein] reductase FabK [Bacillales bacterium]